MSEPTLTNLEQNSEKRIISILKTNSLNTSLTGFPTFHLSLLDISTALDFLLPNNLRLGHLAEKIVAGLIKKSSNYKMLYENIQVTENERTIGEIDFIVKNQNTNQVTHIELAYKFYLFDPTISSRSIENWIGPNRNDSLKEKLDKLKTNQFPLLRNKSAQTKFKNIDIDQTNQALCLLASLYIPYETKISFDPIYEKNIVGHYLSNQSFKDLDKSGSTFYLPPKKEWGMNPAEHDNWSKYEAIRKDIEIAISEKQAPLCWSKNNNVYSQFFIVWW